MCVHVSIKQVFFRVCVESSKAKKKKKKRKEREFLDVVAIESKRIHSG